MSSACQPGPHNWDSDALARPATQGPDAVLWWEARALFGGDADGLALPVAHEAQDAAAAISFGNVGAGNHAVRATDESHGAIADRRQ